MSFITSREHDLYCECGDCSTDPVCDQCGKRDANRSLRGHTYCKLCLGPALEEQKRTGFLPETRDMNRKDR